jgi:sn-glycerol 3-phosphate transport system permease protein
MATKKSKHRRLVERSMDIVSYQWENLTNVSTLPHIALIISSALIVLPVVLTIALSTQTAAQVNDINHGLAPGSVDTIIQNYSTVLIELGFARLLLNTLVVTIFITVGSVLFSLLAALALVYFQFRFRNAAFFLILLTLMIPFEIRVVPLYELIVFLDIHDTYLGVSIPFLATATGIFLFRQKFKSIPIELVEICRMNGIGPIHFLRRVLLPMSKNMIGGLSVIIFTATWNAYLWPSIVINTKERQLIQIGLRRIQSATQGALPEYNLMMAGAVLALFPPLIVLLIMRKYLLNTMELQIS